MASDKISLRDIYDAVNSLEAKIDKRITKIEDRTENLESYRDKAMGVVTASMIILTGVFSWLWRKILPE